MRVLVTGATGYIASRTIPVLLAKGHEVVAAARDVSKIDDYWWSEEVERVSLDVGDEDSVRAALAADLDAIVYLVHGMADKGFREADRRAAALVAREVDAAGISRIVYVSGLIPDIPESELSEHLISRLEVERELSAGKATTITLRAAMIVGSGSTSFELMSQLATRLPVTLIPEWMDHRVEPVSVIEVAKAVDAALVVDAESRSFDVGGGTKLSYPALISLYADVEGLTRKQTRLPIVPERIVSLAAAALTDLPSHTVRALMESLQEDMVAGDDDWREAFGIDAKDALSIDEMLARAVAEPDYAIPASERDPLAALPGDR